MDRIQMENLNIKELSKAIESGGKKIADNAIALTKHGKKNLDVRPY
jgi:hypothetical protein